VKAIHAALEALDPIMMQRSGRVFYSGREAFTTQSDLYVLGLNPGGDPVALAHETITADLDAFRSRTVPWSAYVDDRWNGAPAGQWGMQPRVRHLLTGLGLDPQHVPASNVVFVRSNNEAALEHQKAKLLDMCWPIHRAVIDTLGMRTILCFGKTAGLWVRERLGANEPVGSFREMNRRCWLNEAHRAPGGETVVTLTHPSRADWRNREADPTSFVTELLKAARI